MPTYQYACTACSHAFEQVQSFTDDALTECPECHGRLRKVYNAVGVVFKGSGFYRNDSRGQDSTSTGSSTSTDSGSSSASSSSDSSKGTSSTSSSGSSDGSSKGTSSSSSGSSSGSSGSSTSSSSSRS
ncbi:FmdB family zinc ribbon protein [Nocardioides acrostichi]|uniref:FmdB family transcriptional regulator n=1 Tax=Nocardioides acrostichi TaxID=2784339 RepID=A0A930V0V2_9ACTN|nr:FmdB family zinc ribbon protein [Nocardioides acrostichi]MBF4163646.1 FmdB family transcriptional regulator [Nocardioides acrostichi]